MAEKCIWCGVDDASDYHAMELFGKRFTLCEQCFGLSWELMGRLRLLGKEFGKRAAQAHDGSREQTR